jgi:hypothetical protein
MHPEPQWLTSMAIVTHVVMSGLAAVHLRAVAGRCHCWPGHRLTPVIEGNGLCETPPPASSGHHPIPDTIPGRGHDHGNSMHL